MINLKLLTEQNIDAVRAIEMGRYTPTRMQEQQRYL